MATEIDKDLKRILIKGFLIKAVLAFVVWTLINHLYLIPDGRINTFLTQRVINGTIIGLKMLGYEAAGQGEIISIDNEPVVLVADGCNGLELFVLYAGFLMCFPGKIKFKAIFIPVGVFIIYLINVAREIVLALNYKFFQETFDFNHKYTYVFVVYLAVFAIWRFWLNRYSILAQKA